MRNAIEADRTLGTLSAVRRKRRLHKNFRIDSRFKPYANRLRVRLEHLDLTDPVEELRLNQARIEMSKILVKKGIPDDLLQYAVAQALDIAADHQFENLRRDESLARRDQSENARRRLIKQLRILAQTIAKLPPVAKSKLNKIMTKQKWEDFDTEMLDQLVRAMVDALSESSPKCTADKAVGAIRESHRAFSDPVVDKIIRTAPPVILELWEFIPAETRTQVEAGLRTWQPPTRRNTMEFLSHIVTLLETREPRSKRGRRPAIEQRLAQRLASIWHDLGLHVGRAHNGRSDCQSVFQRFSRVALGAVHDYSRLSGRQITTLKLQTKRSAGQSHDLCGS
jgi:hypothetical protein